MKVRNFLKKSRCSFPRTLLIILLSVTYSVVNCETISIPTIGSPIKTYNLSDFLKSVEVEAVDSSPMGTSRYQTEEVTKRTIGKFEYFEQGNNGMRNSEGRLKRRVAVDEKGRILVHYSPGNSIFLLDDSNNLSELYTVDFGEKSFPDNLYELDPRMLPKYLLQHEDCAGYIENFACFDHVVYFTFIFEGNTYQALYNMNTGHSVIGQFADDLFGVINLGNVPGRNLSTVLNSHGSPIIQLPPFAIDFSKAVEKGLISDESYQQYLNGMPTSNPTLSNCLILHFKDF